jgi:siroheme synthase-like protein
LKEDIQPNFYPILINLKRFPCLIVGGGKVALRKVLSLLEFNAAITVISPRLCKSLIELAELNRIKIIIKAYSKNFLKDFKIVFSATDNPEVNKSVRRDCTAEGILLNVVDNTPLCNFILPANIKRGDLVVSISSQGKAPFYVKALKKSLEEILSPEYRAITGLAGEFRKRLLAGNKAKSTRMKTIMFKKFLSVNWKEILANGGKDNPQIHIDKILDELEK